MKIILVLFMFGYLSLISGSTLVVDNTPSSGWFGSYSCEASFWPDNPYSTIQAAVNDASNNDTIKICKGDYDESVTVNNKDTLTITNGADASSPSDVNWYNNGDGTLNIDGNTKNLTVKNVSIKSTQTNENYKDIHIKSARGTLTLQNLIVDTPNGATAIYGEWGVNANLKGVFKDLKITTKANGIYLNKGALQTFDNCNFTLLGNAASNYGIYLGNSIKDKKHSFKNLHFTLKSQPAILLKHGSKMTFDTISISTDGYGSNTKAIELDWGVTQDDLTFNHIGISLDGGIGISIRKAKNITVDDVNISGSTNQAFFSDSSVSDNLNFTNINLHATSGYALQIENGTNVSIDTADIDGTNGNNGAIFLDWGVVGDYDFKNINLSTHSGGINIKKGNKVTFDTVTIFSDSSSANDKGIVFDNNNFQKMTFTNLDVNTSGDGLKITGSSDLTVDSSKLTTRGDHAIDIGSNVTKMYLKNSCFHNDSNGGNSYAIYINNWNSDLHVNNNCLFAQNGGNYARDAAVHDWDGNYWDGVSDANGDGKISRDDTIKISTNIVDNNPLSSCQQHCYYNGSVNKVKSQQIRQTGFYCLKRQPV